jgi:hypothetical protein
MAHLRVEVSKKKKCSLPKTRQVPHARTISAKGDQIDPNTNAASFSFSPKAGTLDKKAVLKASLIRNREVLEELSKH